MRRTSPDAFSLAPTAALRWPVDSILAALEPCVLPERLARLERAVASRLGSVVAVLEDTVDPHNASAIARTCEGFGVGQLHLIDADNHGAQGTRISRGAERWLTRTHHGSPEACVKALRARGFSLYFAAMDGTLTPDDLSRVPRLAIAVGNEHTGCSPALRALCDGSFAIPMRGLVESFNVSVAAAVALYAATRGREGDLGPEEAREVKARFLLQSVQAAEHVLERYLRDHP